MTKKKTKTATPKEFVSGFKLSSETKRVASTILDKHARGVYKRLMIDAELASLANKRKQSNVDLEKDV